MLVKFHGLEQYFRIPRLEYFYDKLNPIKFNIHTISAGGIFSLALKNDGTIVCWGGDTRFEVCDVPEN